MAASHPHVSRAEGINLARLDLPSSGLLTSGATFGPPPALYVPKKKDTASSVEVTTDPSSLLIRCLQNKKKGSVSRAHVGEHNRSSQDEKKRKVAGGAGTSQEAEAVKPQKKPARDVQRTIYSREKLLQLTVHELKDLCREDHLAVSGKKTDLVERILQSQS